MAFSTPLKANERVVATVKPIHSLAAAVMAGIDTPYLIVKGAASPHSHALKPSDATAIQRARLIFRVGGPFEQFLDSAIARRRETTTVIDLHESDGVKTLPFRTGKAWGNAHSHNHSHGHDDHAFDPHIWLSPDNAVAITLAIAKSLTKASPQHADVFTRNADAAIARIHKLSVSIQTKLKPIGKKPYLVYHDAFQYFERSFGLTATGAIALGDSRAPGAKRIRALRKSIQRKKVACIFTEPQFEPRLARTLTEGTSARVSMLDPIGADIAAGPDAFFEIMQRNAKSLADCLSR